MQNSAIFLNVEKYAIFSSIGWLPNELKSLDFIE